MSDGTKLICQNKKARHNYHLEDKFEAGISLQGTEVKALRAGKANLTDSYAIFNKGELFLLNAHISPYSHGNRENHNPTRSRKLLMHRHQLDKLFMKLEAKGYSLIPTRMYFKGGTVKVEIALGKGKKSHDKRDTIKDRDIQRNMSRQIRRDR